MSFLRLQIVLHVNRYPKKLVDFFRTPMNSFKEIFLQRKLASQGNPKPGYLTWFGKNFFKKTQNCFEQIEKNTLYIMYYSSVFSALINITNLVKDWGVQWSVYQIKSTGEWFGQGSRLKFQEQLKKYLNYASSKFQPSVFLFCSSTGTLCLSTSCIRIGTTNSTKSAVVKCKWLKNKVLIDIASWHFRNS